MLDVEFNIRQQPHEAEMSLLSFNLMRLKGYATFERLVRSNISRLQPNKAGQASALICGCRNCGAAAPGATRRLQRRL